MNEQQEAKRDQYLDLLAEDIAERFPRLVSILRYGSPDWGDLLHAAETVDNVLPAFDALLSERDSRVTVTWEHVKVEWDQDKLLATYLRDGTVFEII